MKGLDTNVLIRHLVQDDAPQARLAGRFIAMECSREDPCFINRIVLCETVWVLESAYGYAREDIASALERIIRTHQLRIENISAAWAALRMYRSGGADFADCLLGETNREAGCLETATLDKRAAKTGGLRLWAEEGRFHYRRVGRVEQAALKGNHVCKRAPKKPNRGWRA